MARNEAQLESLAALVRRYEMLEEHARSEPGRTPARRDSMRALSGQFPGALRELDCLGVDGIVERRDAVRRIFDRVRGGDDAALQHPDVAWIRYAIELLPRLRRVLRIKSWIAHNGGNAAAPDTRARLRAWYAKSIGGGDLDDDLIDRIAAPPGGQVQQIAYRDTARALGVGVDELKRALYPETESADGE